MRLHDCVVKVQDRELWLYHTASSYRVRMDDVALQTLESLIAKAPAEALSEPEAHIRERLAQKGMIVEEATPGSIPGVRVLRKSPLRTLDLELSSKCNLSCGHCFAAMDKRNMMDRSILERIFEGVSELEPVNLVLNGGEPLLNPQWRFAVEEGRRRGLRVVLMTNGTLIDEDTAAFLGDARVAKVAVSLDGFEAQHNALRGSSAFSRTISGIRRLVAAGLQVFISTMLSDETLARREDFERFCLEDLGVTAVRFSAVAPVGKGKSAPAEFRMEDPVLRQMFAKGTDEDELEPVSSSSGEKAWPCEAGVEQIFIASDGQVYACHYFQNLQEPMGDLRVESFAELYRAGLAGPVAAREPWQQLPKCQSCPALATCRGGCRARAKLLAGSFSAPDTYSCKIYR